MIKFIKNHKEIILYLFFGVATTIVNWIIYAVLMGVGIQMTMSNAIAWLVAVIFAFLTNKLFVFESKCWSVVVILKESVSFLGARVFSGVVEVFAPELLFSIGFDYEFFGIKGFSAKALVSIVIIVINYIFSKLVVFSKKRD